MHLHTCYLLQLTELDRGSLPYLEVDTTAVLNEAKEPH